MAMEEVLRESGLDGAGLEDQEEGGGEWKEISGEVLDFSQWYLVLNSMGGYGEEDF